MAKPLINFDVGRIRVKNFSVSVLQECSLKPLTAWLLCRTPQLNFPGENITETNPKEVHYGFNLDGVTTYRNLSTNPRFGALLYYPDPVVDNLPIPTNGGKKYSKDDTLVIKVRGDNTHLMFNIFVYL